MPEPVRIDVEGLAAFMGDSPAGPHDQVRPGVVVKWGEQHTTTDPAGAVALAQLLMHEAAAAELEVMLYRFYVEAGAVGADEARRIVAEFRKFRQGVREGG